MSKIAFPRTMRNLDPGKLSSALAENMRYLENMLNTIFSFDHDILTNVGVGDHHDKYTDAEAAAKIAADDLYLKLAGDIMLGSIDMGGASVTNAEVFQIQAGGSFNMPGPDTDDLWRVYAQDAGDSWNLVQFDDSAGSQYQRIVVFGKGTAVNDEGDIWLKDFESNMLLQWDESDDQWEFYKNVDFGGNVIDNPLDPTLGTHVGDRDYNDARYASGGNTYAVSIMVRGA